MAYRSDDDAENERLRALSAQMADLELRLAERNVLRAHKERVDAQLQDAASAAAKRRAKVPLPLLSRIRVASPCHERWDQMSGDERVRHCASCDKDVYDLSEMTSAEAEELLANVGEAACVRLHRRADGTVITADCPIGAKRKRRNRWLAAGAGIAGTAVAAASALVTIGIDVAKTPVGFTGTVRAVDSPIVIDDEPEAMPDYELAVPMAGAPMFVPPPEDPAVEDAPLVDEPASDHRSHRDGDRRERRRRRAHAP
jgi:hypothetical protein